MAVDTKVSLVLSSIVTLLLFSGMQIYKPWLISTKLHVVIAGYIGSMVFLFSLTALGNLETILFGRSFQVKFIPEVFTALVFALISAGLVHRVATTVCFFFSMMTLYFLNRISQETYSSTAHPPTANIQMKKKK
ncbi:keratinocyte-associated protein 2 [Trichogramma pretiosum]|nr:keratinocyte-associated protein 2 [Trichogramma pretiosum]